MPAEEAQFTFPHEEEERKKSAELQETSEKTDDLEIEVVDDTPPEDRGREPMPKEIVDELEQDDLEEYSEKVKRRLSQMKKVWHDERRAKEALQRERDEAMRFAQAQFEQTKALKSRLGHGEKVFKSEMTRAVEGAVASAKAKLKAAYEGGDAEEIADAQEALTDAKLQLRELSRFQPSLQEEDDGVQQAHQTRVPDRVRPDAKAVAWQEKNTWFGTDEEMTALALGLHEKLVKSGVDPNSDDYYRQINKTMRRRFPEYFSEDDLAETPDTGKKSPTPRKTPATVVAPAKRTNAASRQVKLTPSQIAIAKRLGLTNEAYAREVLKLQEMEND